jgi:hypothetical protein
MPMLAGIAPVIPEGDGCRYDQFDRIVTIRSAGATDR